VVGEIARYELAQLTRSRQFWFIGLVFAAMGVVLMAYAGDIVGGGNINVNAPNNIILFVNILSFFAMFLVASMVASSVTRDFEIDSWQVVFSCPVSWRGYLLGRFIGSLLAACLCYAFVIPGLIAGAHGPWSSGTVGPFHAWHYLYAFVVLAVPNLFVLSALLFAVSTLTRKTLAAYAGAVLIFVLFNLGNAAINEESMEPFVFLVDLFGISTLNLTTRYWTPYELNTQLAPLAGTFLWNRLIWLGVGVAAMAWTLVRFNPYPRSPQIKANVPAETGQRNVDERPIATQVHDRNTAWQQLVGRVGLEVRAVVRSIPFVVLMILGFVNAWALASLVDPVFGAPPLLLTRVAVKSLGDGLTLPLLIVIAYYAGELVWRERQVKLDQIVDAMPARNTVFLLSKLLALWTVVAALLAVSIAAMVILQLIKGTPIDASMYLREMGYRALPFLWVGALALIGQVLSPNKYLGMLFMVIYIAVSLASSTLFDMPSLVVPGSHPTSPISGLANSTFYRLEGLKHDLYWAALSVVLVMLAHLLWRRGTDEGIARRLRVAKRRIGVPQAATLAISLMAFAGIGRWLYVEDYVDNPIPPSDAVTDATQLRYEQVMRPLENKPLPVMKSVRLDLSTDLQTRRATSRGEIVLRNKHDRPFDTLYVALTPLAKVKQLSVEGGVVDQDFADIHVARYRFTSPMQPGETRTVRFDLDVDFSNFPGGQLSSRLETSGTALSLSEVMPDVLGYSSYSALGDPRKRAKHGLPEDRAHIATLDEPWGRDFNGLFGQSDNIDFEGTYSVDKGQVAFMGGELVRSWEQGDRAFFHYKSKTPISLALTLQQGAYRVLRDRAAGIDLAIYYNPPDDFHVAEFMKHFKIAVEYFTAEFGPFPYPEFRLIQKAFDAGANSNSGQLTLGEFAGFVSDLSKNSAVDWGTHVVGHEAGHNWWGLMVTSAKVEGATMLQETLAQYAGLMTLEKSYDKAMVARFLRESIKKYNADRNKSKFAEVPVYRSRSDTDYVHYWKGAPVIYGVKELIGEQALNQALREYFAKWAFASGPYPTSLDLLAIIRAHTPEQYQQTLTDYFERILLHDLSVSEARVETLSGGRFKVIATIRTKKMERTAEGSEQSVPLHEPVQIAVVDEEINRGDRYSARWLASERRWIDAERTQVEFIVNERPGAVVVDPYHNFIERNLDDNVKLLH
jgi:hypothetical protein